AGGGEAQGGGEEGRGAAAVGAGAPAASAGRGEPRARSAGGRPFPLRQAQREDRTARGHAGDGAAARERRGRGGGGPRQPGACGGARGSGEAHLRGGQEGGPVLVRSGEADRIRAGVTRPAARDYCRFDRPKRTMASTIATAAQPIASGQAMRGEIER